jgi:hypothetical protein
MSIAERVRAAAEATAATVGEIRPLALPADPGTARPGLSRSRAPRTGRGWGNWLIPLAAAVAVIAVAASLAAVRGLSAAGSRPAPASTSTGALAGGLPRYYVAIGYQSAGPKGGLVQSAYLGDTSTGKHLAALNPPSDAMFNYVAASSDDITFVLRAIAGPNYGPSGVRLIPSEYKKGIPQTTLWYVLRVNPADPGRSRLTRVPIAAAAFSDTGILGEAVSPDGRTLAVLIMGGEFIGNKVAATPAPTMVRTYSLATGRLLRTWTYPTRSLESPPASLAWLNDGRTLAFVYPSINAPEYIRTLNTGSPGTSLIADSRPVFSVPAACDTPTITADGKSVVCGSYTPQQVGCVSGAINLSVYSLASGKREGVVYRYPGACSWGGIQVQWARSGTLAIAEVVYNTSAPGHPQLMETVGVVPPGKPAALNPNLGETFNGYGSIAF